MTKPDSTNAGGLPKRKKGWATAGVTFAVPGLVVPGLGVLAILFGVVGLTKKNADRGMAVWALMLGCMGTFFSFTMVLPAVRQAFDLQDRVHCQSNLSQIGRAINDYLNNNRGQFPPDLATVMIQEKLDSRFFVSPATNDTPARGSTPAEQASHLNEGGHLSYVYLGKDMNLRLKGDTIVAYDRSPHRVKRVRHVLYLDGSVLPLTETEFKAALAAQGVTYIPPK
jgi:hypothetical protein